MALDDLTGKIIKDTYQKVVQTDGTNLTDGTGSALPIKFDGPDLIVSGALIANSYIVSESITNISSGSTVFGNTQDDTHTLTGSLNVTGSIFLQGGTSGDGPTITTTKGNLKLTSTDSTYVEVKSNHADYGLIIRDYDSSAWGNISANEGNLRLGYSTVAANQGIFITEPSTNTNRVGIGTASPSYTLDVGGAFRATGDIYANGNIVGDNVTTITGMASISASTLASLNLKGSGSVATGFKVLGFISASGNITGSNIFASGDGYFSNVGIGTTSPGEKLEVIGTISASGDTKASNFYAANTYRINDSGGTSRHFIARYNNTISLGNTNFDGINLTGSLSTNGHITSSGNISASGDVYADKFISNNVQVARHNDGINFFGKSGTPTELVGNVTASSNIRVSGSTTTAINLDTSGHITASGHVSSSGGNIYGLDYFDNNVNINTIYSPIAGGGSIVTVGALDAGSITSNFGSINVGADAITTTGTLTGGPLVTTGNTSLGTGATHTHTVIGNITSSGNLRITGSTTTAINLDTSGNITASGNISASGAITATGNILTDGNVTADFYNSTTSVTGFKLNGAKYLWLTSSDLQVGNDAIDTDIIGTSINLQSPVTASSNLRISGSTTTAINLDTSGHITASGNITASYSLAKIPMIQYTSTEATSVAQGRVLAASSHDNETDSFALEWDTPLFEDTDFFETGSVSPDTTGVINTFAVKHDGRYEISCGIAFRTLGGARPGLNLGIFTSSKAIETGSLRAPGVGSHGYSRYAGSQMGTSANIANFVIQLDSGSAISMKVDYKDDWGGVSNTVWSGSLSYFNMKKIG